MLQFGFSVVPTADLAAHEEQVAIAEEGGLDLVGIQDHPYAPSLVDTFSLIAVLLAKTERLRFFPDVANLPLRPPAMLAETSATLDVLSGGRFELGLGAGGNRPAIEAMGAPALRPAQAVEALAEAVTLLRALWRPGQAVRFRGRHYVVDGVRPGPGPAHPIGIWIGSQSPGTLRLTGKVADGWAAPIASYLPYETWPGANVLIDKTARDARRDPADILRIAQLVGTITDATGDAEATVGAAPIRGTPDQWATLIARLATDQPFRAFIFWPERQSAAQVHRFAHEVAPAARALLDG